MKCGIGALEAVKGYVEHHAIRRETTDSQPGEEVTKYIGKTESLR